MRPLLNTLIIFLLTYLVVMLLLSFLAALPLAADTLPMLYITQTLHTLLLFGASTLIISHYNGERHPLRAHLLSRPAPYPLLLSILIAILFTPAVTFLTEWNEHITLPDALHHTEQIWRTMEERSRHITEQMAHTDSPLRLALNITVMAFLPALCEELFFRGTIQRYIHPLVGTHSAVWITAILFSAIHFQFFGFIPRTIMGAILGYTYHYSRTLWAPIAAHFANNALVLAVIYYEYRTHTTTISTLGTNHTTYLAPLSALITLALLLLMRRHYRNTKNRCTK